MKGISRNDTDRCCPFHPWSTQTCQIQFTRL